MALSLFLHVLGVVVWVGGKFFPWVWASVALILLTGLYMLMLLGGTAAPHYAMAMLALGVLMMLIFAHVFFVPYKKLKRAVGEQNWKAGGAALAQIRMLIGINLGIGLVTIAVVFLGRALAP